MGPMNTHVPHTTEPHGAQHYLLATRYNRSALVAHLVLAGIVCAALLAPLVRGPALAQRLSVSLDPPALFSASSQSGALLGTDSLGRDLGARLLLATRVSLAVGGLAVAVACVVGTVLGLLCGYLMGWFDNLVMRVVDALLSLPFVVLAIAIVAAIGPGLVNVAMVLGLTGWITFAKLVRGEVLRIRQQPFVEAARCVGCSHLRILFLHIAPHVLGIVLVGITLTFGQMIIAEATLSFLGLGIPPPTPTLGGILAGAQETFFAAWWLVAFPGVILMAIVLSVNVVGDWLRDYFDPHVPIPVVRRER
ncbi:MAG: ABC transporter permease [Spirochaetaceae bacterium]|nr:MAG: ABC transporter permease [Spirochaetaceae bacterium]